MKPKHPGLIEEERGGAEDKGEKRGEEEMEMATLGGEPVVDDGDEKVEADKADEEAASEWGGERKEEAEATQLQPSTSPRSFPLITSAEGSDWGGAGAVAAVGAAAAAAAGEEGAAEGSIAAPNSPAHSQH